MERKMRRMDRAISESEAIKLLRKGEYGILSTVSLDGQPYGVPVNFCYTKEVIYFHSALEGHKIENIRENSKVSFCVVGKTEILPEEFGTKYESAIVYGKVIEVVGKEKHDGLFAIVKKYSPGFAREGLKYIGESEKKARVFKIAIKSITGKSRKK
jgi:nitroimidazol reductase NimA-like FMN-containing flavoprotein (pyridoxamine 5'-phosphate oxidase superfamily)